MKNFLKPLIGTICGIFLVSSVFAITQRNNSKLELSQYSTVYTDDGTPTGTPVAWINTGGDSIFYGPLLDGGLNPYITGVDLSSYGINNTSDNYIPYSSLGNFYSSIMRLSDSDTITLRGELAFEGMMQYITMPNGQTNLSFDGDDMSVISANNVGGGPAFFANVNDGGSSNPNGHGFVSYMGGDSVNKQGFLSLLNNYSSNLGDAFVLEYNAGVDGRKAYLITNSGDTHMRTGNYLYFNDNITTLTSGDKRMGVEDGFIFESYDGASWNSIGFDGYIPRTAVDTGWNHTGSDTIIPSEKTVWSLVSGLTNNYIPFWDGNRFINSSILDSNNIVIGVDNSSSCIEDIPTVYDCNIGQVCPDDASACTCEGAGFNVYAGDVCTFHGAGTGSTTTIGSGLMFFSSDDFLVSALKYEFNISQDPIYDVAKFFQHKGYFGGVKKCMYDSGIDAYECDKGAICEETQCICDTLLGFISYGEICSKTPDVDFSVINTGGSHVSISDGWVIFNGEWRLGMSGNNFVTQAFTGGVWVEKASLTND